MQPPPSSDSPHSVGPSSATVAPDPVGVPEKAASEPQRTGDFTPDPAAVLIMTRSDGDQPPTPREQPIPAIDGYEILGELGRGGMGVVYRARHVRLNRLCVLKMIAGGAHAGAEAGARFLAEANAVARLQHPNIVQIHHIGEADGLPFFELEYLSGGSLDRRLNGTPWPARRAAELIEPLARAVAEAHRSGIVHRDLKPGNVLLADDGTPKISDFGLAKSLTRDSGLTQTGAILGSPSYMAPEQAEGHTREVGPPADVYALGAILYELLTGRPPFRGATVLETLEQVKTAEPVPPSRLVPGLPADVETIALKCLQKEPGRRYDSATALAEDLRRFLGGEPILARPVGPLERTWRWCRRHPGPSSLTATVLLVAALGLAGVLWQWGEAVKARDLAYKRSVAEAEARREAETTLVDMYTTSGISAGDQGEHARAALWFANAARRAKADPDRRLANAVRARTWGRRAFTPLRAFVAADSWPGGLVFHPGGHYLLTRTVIDGKARDSNFTLWDLDAEQPLSFPGGLKAVPAAAWSPDGRALAVGRPDGDVLVAGFPGGEERFHIRFPGRIRLLTWSADGRYLAIAGGPSARVWDCQVGAFATPDLVHPAAVTTLAFHPKSRYLATGCSDNGARLFAIPSDAGQPLWPPVPHQQAESRALYDPQFCSPPLFVDGGQGLITWSGTGGLTWRAVQTGMQVRTLDSPEFSNRIGGTELRPRRALSRRLHPSIPSLCPALRDRHGSSRGAGRPVHGARLLRWLGSGPGSRDRDRPCRVARASGQRVLRQFQPRRAAARDGLPRSHGPGLGLAGRRAGLPAVRARQGRRRRDLHAGRALGALGERRRHRPRLGLANRQAGHAAAGDWRRPLEPRRDPGRQACGRRWRPGRAGRARPRRPGHGSRPRRALPPRRTARRPAAP